MLILARVKMIYNNLISFVALNTTHLCLKDGHTPLCSYGTLALAALPSARLRKTVDSDTGSESHMCLQTKTYLNLMLIFSLKLQYICCG